VQRKVLHSLFLSLLVAAPAIASVYVALSQDEMVAASDAVVEGHVIGVRSHWNAEKTAIVTDARVQVDESIFGGLPDLMTVRTIGGQVGKIRIQAEGSPTFERGQNVLLFLHRRGDGTFGVYSEQFGQYLLVADAAGGKTAVSAVSPEVRILNKRGVAEPRPKSLPAEELKEQIRQAAIRNGKL
jgi:hypothetical protein